MQGVVKMFDPLTNGHVAQRALAFGSQLPRLGRKKDDAAKLRPGPKSKRPADFQVLPRNVSHGFQRGDRDGELPPESDP